MRKPAANSRPWLPRRPQGFSRKEDSMPEYHTHRWTRLSRAFRRQHPLCAECQRKGRIAEAEVTDHIIPPWVEGVDFWDASNWQPLCRRCNLAKGARDRIKWPLDTRKGEGGSNLSAQAARPTLLEDFNRTHHTVFHRRSIAELCRGYESCGIIIAHSLCYTF